MSDEDRDVDIESEDDDLDGDEKGSGGQYQTQAEKRAHHNALERKRRDHIKDSFSGLRDSIPALHGEKVASRAQILKKAADYIQSMRKKNTIHQQDIDDLKRQNHMLEAQIRTLEKSRVSGSFPGGPKGGGGVPDSLIAAENFISAFDGGSGTETSDSESASHQQRRKKMKVVSSSSAAAALNSSSDT